MEMIARLLMVFFIVLPFASAEASKKQEDKFEYLIPEDYKDGDPPRQPERKPGLDLTVNAYKAGMKKFIREEQDCKSTKVGEAQSVRDGQAMVQEFTLESATVQALAEVAGDGSILTLKFNAPVRDDDHQVLIACTTYALMRTIQPKYASPKLVHGDTLHLWREAQTKPFTKAFFFNKFVAQVIPLQVEIF